ncbi:MAG: dethiobiotin synthase [Alphaproteobacteria bacterium]
MAAIFVTSCGTGRGKTYVSENMIRDWQAAGEAVQALKPVISGFDPAAVDETDTGVLLAALEQDPTPDAIDRVSPWRYAAPLSPDMAAALEGRSVPVDEIVSYCRSAIEEATASGAHLLIEGAGGVMVPLDETRTMRDLMAALDIPVVLVVGSYLGSLSHALTALEALRVWDIAVEKIVVNETADSDIPLSETRDTLARFVGGVTLETLRFSPPSP